MRLTLTHGRRLLRAATTLLGLALAGLALASLAHAAAPAASPDALRLTLVWVCAAVAAAAYAVTVHGLVTTAPGGPGRGRAELFWAVIPVVIVIALASPAVDGLAKRAAGAAAATAITTSAAER